MQAEDPGNGIEGRHVDVADRHPLGTSASRGQDRGQLAHTLERGRGGARLTAQHAVGFDLVTKLEIAVDHRKGAGRERSHGLEEDTSLLVTGRERLDLDRVDSTKPSELAEREDGRSAFQTGGAPREQHRPAVPPAPTRTALGNPRLTGGQAGPCLADQSFRVGGRSVYVVETPPHCAHPGRAGRVDGRHRHGVDPGDGNALKRRRPDASGEEQHPAFGVGSSEQEIAGGELPDQVAGSASGALFDDEDQHVTLGHEP
jgi:hypothetical protein